MLTHVVNLMSALLGNGAISCKLRALLYNSLGNKLPVLRKGRIKGGCYVYGGGLAVGNGCLINRGCYFDLTNAITFGDNVCVGHGCTFITAGHDVGPPEKRCGDLKSAPIVVENGVWIGANVTILSGVTIGSGSIIGAGLLVRKTLAKNSVLA